MKAFEWVRDNMVQKMQLQGVLSEGKSLNIVFVDTQGNELVMEEGSLVQKVRDNVE
jgi:hypothetical protein